MSLFQDGGPGIISRRKVMPPGECTRSICPAPLQCSVFCPFLVYSTFILVTITWQLWIWLLPFKTKTPLGINHN